MNNPKNFQNYQKRLDGTFTGAIARHSRARVSHRLRAALERCGACLWCTCVSARLLWLCAVMCGVGSCVGKQGAGERLGCVHGLWRRAHCCARLARSWTGLRGLGAAAWGLVALPEGFAERGGGWMGAGGCLAGCHTWLLNCPSCQARSASFLVLRTARERCDACMCVPGAWPCSWFLNPIP